MYLLVSKLFQGLPYLYGVQPDASAEAGDDLAGGDVAAFLQSGGVAVVHQDQFAGRVGRLETAVVAVQLLDLVVLEPIGETAVEQGFRLCVDPLVGDPCRPRVVDGRHFERQPATVAGVVGEELQVVAGGAERGHVRQVHLVAPVGGAFVYIERGGHRLELVQLAAQHGVDLLEVDEEVRRHGEEVVLGEPLRVGLRGVVEAERRGQEVLEERGLEAALPPDQDEDDVVHHPFVQGSGHHPHHPAAEAEVEAGGIAIGGVHHRGEAADMVRHPVPRPGLFEELLQWVVGRREVGEQERAQVEEVRFDPCPAHGAPKGVFECVAHGLPALRRGPPFIEQAGFEEVRQAVHAQFHVPGDELLHLSDCRLAAPPPASAAEIGKAECGVLGREGVAAPRGRTDGGGVIVGEGFDCPRLGFSFGHAEPVHVVEAPADVVVVAARPVAHALFFDQPAHDLFRPLDGRSPPVRSFPGRSGRGISCLPCSFCFEGERGGFGAVERIGVVADHRHTGGVLALAVDGDAGEVGVVVVHRLPSEGEVVLPHFASDLRDGAYAPSGEGGVDEERVRVFADFGECGGERLGGYAVDVHHDETRIAGDVRLRAPFREADGGDEGGPFLLEAAQPAFLFFALLPFCGEEGAVEGGGGGVPPVGEFMHDLFPCGGLGRGGMQRGETRRAECVFCFFHVKSV